MMRLTVQMKRSNFGTIPMICDEGGEPLPGQVETVMNGDCHDLSTITVTFLIDGKRIVSVGDN